MARPSPLTVLRRRPSTRTIVVTVAALAAGLLTFRINAEAADTSALYGNPVEVWVAADPLEPGLRLGSDDVRTVARPEPMVPDEAVTTDPAGRTVRGPLATGQVVTERQLADGTSAGPAALIPDGWRGLSIGAVDGVPPLSPGSVVDVVAGVPGNAGGVLAADAVVIAVDEEAAGAITVAVPAEVVAAVAAAVDAGIVALSLVR